MFEKVNPDHPDKLADRIAGALVDLAYKKNRRAEIAVELTIGHRHALIITESSETFTDEEVAEIVERITGQHISITLIQVPQDKHLADNQKDAIRCGDNGIFKGEPVTDEQIHLTAIARDIYDRYEADGKYILDGDELVICQSNADSERLRRRYKTAAVNPLGDWTGGIDVDTGSVNRKLGSDMGDSVTGGGLHGKDLSKADVSVNVYAWLKAQKTGETAELFCKIGDDTVDGKPYNEIVEIAREYIDSLGGFEKFAEWGLIR